MRCSLHPPFQLGGKEGAWSLGETMPEFGLQKRKIFSPKEKCLLEGNFIPICLTLKSDLCHVYKQISRQTSKSWGEFRVDIGNILQAMLEASCSTFSVRDG